MNYYGTLETTCYFPNFGGKSTLVIYMGGLNRFLTLKNIEL